MVIEGIQFLQGDDDMTEPEKIHHEAPTSEPTETPEVTVGHPDDDAPNELAPDAEVDALVDGVSTEPTEAVDGN